MVRGEWFTTPGSRLVRRLKLTGRRPPYVLHVHLLGGYYRYRCPSAELFLAFLAAPSAGRFYNAFVKGKLNPITDDDE